MSSQQGYTDKQKAAYYKKIALAHRRMGSRRVLKGRGDYSYRSSKNKNYNRRKTFGERASKITTQGLISPVIQAIGGPLAGYAAKGLEWAVDQGIKFFSGRGSYAVQENALLNPVNPGMTPIMNPIKDDGAVRFRRCEYITDIKSGPTLVGLSTVFNSESFYVNPGLVNTFQWLSQVAINFEEYELEGLYFEYRSMSANALNSTNTALGQVVLAAEYNAANTPFASKQEMENYEGGISVKPSESVRFFLECARSKNVLGNMYIRPGPTPTGQDQRLYDLANFQIATNGMQAANVNLGELWVCYQVALRKPKLYVALGNRIDYAILSTTGYSNSQPLGSTGTIIIADPATNMTVNVDNASLTITGNTITFYRAAIQRSYMITLWWQGASGATIAFPAPSVTSTMDIELTGNAPQVGSTGMTLAGIQYLINIPANLANPTFTLGSGTLPGGVNTNEIVISQLPSAAHI